MRHLVFAMFLLSICWSGICHGASPRSTHEELADALSSVATKIADRVRGHDEGSISVGTFTISKKFDSADPVIVREAIHLALNTHGKISVKSRTRLELTGRIYPQTDKQSLTGYLEISFVLEDNNGPLGDPLPFATKNHNLIPMILGANISIPVAPVDDRVRGQVIRALVETYADDSAQRPAAPIADDTRVMLGGYGMELLVNGRPCRLSSEEGMAVATLDTGDQYSVRLINNTDSEAAVELLVDGLSMFHFSELRRAEDDKPRIAHPLSLPRYSHMVIGPSDDTIIPGWHVNDSVSRAFLVTGFPESALGKLIGRGGLRPEKQEKAGTIKASFSRAWKPNMVPDPKHYGPTIGTGIGVDVKQAYQEVKRTFGKVSEILTIRYRAN